MQEVRCTGLGGTPGSPTRSEPLPVEPRKKMRGEKDSKLKTKLKTVYVKHVSTSK